MMSVRFTAHVCAVVSHVLKQSTCHQLPPSRMGDRRRISLRYRRSWGRGGRGAMSVVSQSADASAGSYFKPLNEREKICRFSTTARAAASADASENLSLTSSPP